MTRRGTTTGGLGASRRRSNDEGWREEDDESTGAWGKRERGMWVCVWGVCVRWVCACWGWEGGGRVRACAIC